jgi:hypothetical protein
MRSEIRNSLRSEFLWVIVIGFAGLVPRFCFITLFPTNPISDFRGIVDFAVAIRDSGFAKGAWYWEVFNPGVSSILSVVLLVFRDVPDAAARWSTAVITGLFPLLPYGIWRGTLSLRVRVTAGLLLALWPGQILFSGVVAQDNWVILPTGILAALAVRVSVHQEGGHPFWAAVLLALGTFIRQEMVVVLLPLSLAAAGLGTGGTRWLRNLSAWAAVAAISLLFVAGQRATATGRFTLTTEHGGKTMLGAYVPGAGLNYWIDPAPYLASVDPVLLQDKGTFQKESFRLVLREFLGRPSFHVIRMGSSVLNCLKYMDTFNCYWSLTAQDALPPGYRQKAAAFTKRVSPYLDDWLVLIHTLFLASFFLGLLTRNRSILVIATAIGLKILIHGIIVSQPRFFIVVVALEILVIALGIEDALKDKSIRYVPIAGGAMAVVLLLGVLSAKAQHYILAHDDVTQRVYRFSLTDPRGRSLLRCTLKHGRLVHLEDRRKASTRLFHDDPAPGETATAECRLTGSGSPSPLSLRLSDPYDPGGLPNRILQRVIVDGQEVFHHDIAAQPGSGWSDIPLGRIGEGTEKSVLIEILAVNPEPGWGWGAASTTAFQLAPQKTE